MDHYLGYTQQDLINRFIYDPKTGTLMNKKTNKVITSTKDGRIVVSVRRNGKIVNLSGPRLALMIMDGRALNEDETIKFIDGNSLNIAYHNLSVVPRISKLTKPQPLFYKAHPTETDGVFLMTNGVPIQDFFVVRRGSNQAVYRTKDYEEAVMIRKEWESDHSIHRWDNTYSASFKKLLVS